MLTSPPGEQQTVVILMELIRIEGPSRIIECIDDLNTDSIPLKRALPSGVVKGDAGGWHPPNNLEGGWHPPSATQPRSR
jgi:hypothetical protein